MKFSNIYSIKFWLEQREMLKDATLHLLLALVIGVLAGSASAIFLISLEWVTEYREMNTWIILFLPIGGLLIGLGYHYYGQDIVRGNNQLLDEYYINKQKIPFKMAPMVLVGTLITHLFGGSAGREGTAVQMAGAISDQFQKVLGFRTIDRKILIIMGISAGFASVFGTPLAGAVFALEVLIIGRMRYEAILPSFLAAFVADFTCHLWPATHTIYTIQEVPEFMWTHLFWCLLAGIIFGWTARLFAAGTHLWSDFFKRFISYPPLRPFVGGIILAAIFFAMGSTRYAGLGVPVIEQSFHEHVLPWDFILKLLFTAFTLGAGFKGGEVTPLFFIGATLGNILVWFIPLPFPLLAGMGFVAVFAGATNTPIACILMGIELFGADGATYLAIACVTAYLFSGHGGIYGAQIIGSPKSQALQAHKSSSLEQKNQERK